MDKAIVGACRVGYCRVGVYRPDFDRLVKRLESLGSLSAEFTRRRLQLDSPPDSTTGWYSKSFEDFTIDGVLVERSTSRVSMVAGVHILLDATLVTADVLELGDEVYDDYSNRYYEVKGVKSYKIGNSFSHRECDLSYLPLHGKSYSSSTPDVRDARYNTKNYWDTYLDSDNLQHYNYLVSYSEADYPFVRVFENKSIDILFTIDTPNSTAEIGHDQTPTGYIEHVATHILSLDTKLNHLAETELRRITEAYPTGSLRHLDRQDSMIHNFGSTLVYDTEIMLRYRRDTT